MLAALPAMMHRSRSQGVPRTSGTFYVLHAFFICTCTDVTLVTATLYRPLGSYLQPLKHIRAFRHIGFQALLVILLSF